MTSEWIEHDGKDMPVDGASFVTAKYADGLERYDEARFLHSPRPEVSDWVWTDPDDELNIVAYKVHPSQALTPSKEKVETAS